MFRRCTIISGVLWLAFSGIGAVSAQADVFNMGGTRDPTTGAWTGSASLEFVSVGDPGNAADTAVMKNDGTTGYGSVWYTYRMGKYDVTVGQYVQFLNAVAKTDAYGLYSSGMATDLPTIGITQCGSSGSYSYAVSGSYGQAANCPVFDVTWGDAARFCNWLQNGQLTNGVENASTSETGAYTLNGAITDAALMTVTRNAGATYVIPTENEWYKAAYYDPTLNGGAGGYWTYSTKSNTPPTNVLSSTGTNNANFSLIGGNGSYTDRTNYLTPVGAFAASPGPYGTFDMGGDVWQWNEANISGEYRGLRGGAWGSSGSAVSLGAIARGGYGTAPAYEGYDGGFRVASVPEPGSFALLLAGTIVLLAYAWRRRKRAA